MAVHGWTLFETPIGICGVAWSEAGIVGIQLPEGEERAIRKRLRHRYPDVDERVPTGEVRQAIDAIVSLLSGDRVDLTDAVIDLEGVPSFERRVYAAARTIPPGETLTYGELARRVEEPGGAQAIGRALGRNPVPIIVPCHRVLGADGKVGGFSARGGVATKVRILAIEKARTNKAPALFDDLPLAVRPGRLRG